MFCKNCGNELVDTMKFCPACGAKVEKTAPVEAQAPVQPAAPKKLKGKWSAIIITVLALLIVCGGIAALVHSDVMQLSFFSSEENTTGEAGGSTEADEQTAGGAIIHSNTEPTAQAARPAFPDNLTIINEKGHEISLYMERSEVEAILGQPIQTEERSASAGYMTESVYSDDSSNLLILYLDQNVMGISLESDSGTNWRLKNGITIGAPANLESLQQTGNIDTLTDDDVFIPLEDLDELPTDNFTLMSYYRIENGTAYALGAGQFMMRAESVGEEKMEQELAQLYNYAAMEAYFKDGKCLSISIYDLSLSQLG